MAKNYVLYIEREKNENPHEFVITQQAYLDFIGDKGGEVVAVVADLEAQYNVVRGVWVYWKEQ